jgi:hypothetical protein
VKPLRIYTTQGLVISLLFYRYYSLIDFDLISFS